MMVRRKPERPAPKFRPKPSWRVWRERIWSLLTRSGRLKSYLRTSTPLRSRRVRVKMGVAGLVSSTLLSSAAANNASISDWSRTSTAQGLHGGPGGPGGAQGPEVGIGSAGWGKRKTRSEKRKWGRGRGVGGGSHRGGGKKVGG